MNLKNLALASIIFTTLSCSQTKTPSAVKPASTGLDQTKTVGPVIVKIVSRDSVIVARAGADGPVYSVESKTGEVLMPSMTLDQMTALHPEMADKVKTMQAMMMASEASSARQ